MSVTSMLDVFIDASGSQRPFTPVGQRPRARECVRVPVSGLSSTAVLHR